MPSFLNALRNDGSPVLQTSHRSRRLTDEPVAEIVQGASRLFLDHDIRAISRGDELERAPSLPGASPPRMRACRRVRIGDRHVVPTTAIRAFLRFCLDTALAAWSRASTHSNTRTNSPVRPRRSASTRRTLDIPLLSLSPCRVSDARCSRSVRRPRVLADNLEEAIAIGSPAGSLSRPVDRPYRVSGVSTAIHQHSRPRPRMQCASATSSHA